MVGQNREFEKFERIGVEPHRSYYIPFNKSDKLKRKYRIIDRTSSSRFISLDGVWQIKEHSRVFDIDVNEELSSAIPVPSCVQMHGYDSIQYINYRYPFPVIFPKVPNDNPCYHYRRKFTLNKKEGEKYYINFEGVDSAFYLYINGILKGYSQISHSTSEFDITNLVKNGENTIDVIVLKWCISSYFECQDKFRFTGIFRNVYILERPQKHITDYRVITKLQDDKGLLTFVNESKISVIVYFNKAKILVQAKKSVELLVNNVKKWTSESPNLYDLKI